MGFAAKPVAERGASDFIVCGGSLYAGVGGVSGRLIQNELTLLPSWRETNEGRPHRFIATTVYELPFGRVTAQSNATDRWIQIQGRIRF